MKGIVVVGIVLMLIGVVGFAAGRIGITTKEKVVDIGPIEITADKERSIPIPDIAAALALIAGIGLVVAGTRKA